MAIKVQSLFLFLLTACGFAKEVPPIQQPQIFTESYESSSSSEDKNGHVTSHSSSSQVDCVDGNCKEMICADGQCKTSGQQRQSGHKLGETSNVLAEPPASSETELVEGPSILHISAAGLFGAIVGSSGTFFIVMRLRRALAEKRRPLLLGYSE